MREAFQAATVHTAVVILQTEYASSSHLESVEGRLQEHRLFSGAAAAIT